MAFLGRPQGFTPVEIEGWLRELIGVADEAVMPGLPGDDQPETTRLPRMLHQALTGLLFYQSELWPGDEDPCTIALVDEGGAVALGWVGGASTDIEMQLDGRRFEPEWVRVRDEEDREARAFVLHDRQRQLRLHLVWNSHTGDQATLDASWSPASVPATPADAVAPAAERAPEPVAAGPVRERSPWHFRSWVSDLASAAPDVPVTPPESGPSEPPAFVPPSPDIPLVIERIQDDALQDVEQDTAGVPDQIPPTPEPLALIESTAPVEWEEAPFETAFEFDPVPESEPETVVDAAPSQPASAVTESAAPEEFPAPSAHSETSEAPVMEPAAPVRRTIRRPDWPAPVDEHPPQLPIRRLWPWGALVVALFVGGWLVGALDTSRDGTHGGWSRLMQGLGFGPSRFELVIESRPVGAAIAVDGAAVTPRTPARIDLPPGSHQITLSFPGLGSATYNIRGERGQHVPLAAALWGSLLVSAPQDGPAIAVTVDEIARGTAPMAIDSLSPGLHQVRFSGPGLQPWERAVDVRVNRTSEVIAQATLSPATGFLEVRATSSDETTTQTLTGAAVWIDGQPRGVTPLRLELAQGPHSIRVSSRGDEAAIQVIDLPGGNQRFATFDFGLATQRPRLVQTSPMSRMALDHPAVMSASLQGVSRGEVREMWLHVRGADGSWRRYALSMLDAPAGVVGVSVFPTTQFDGQGRALYYLSASTQTGDEYFTEIQTALAVVAPH